MISSILAGYAWDLDNPFVAERVGAWQRAGAALRRVIVAAALAAGVMVLRGRAVGLRDVPAYAATPAECRCCACRRRRWGGR
jgi:hypothetical protein